MSATINIVPAMEADLPLIAKLAVTSMSVHLLFRIIYPSNNPLDTTKAEHDVLKDLQHQAKNPAARIFKACSTENGADIVGYMMFRFADGPIDDVIAPASDKIVSSAAAEATTKLGNDGGTTNVAFLSKVSSLLKPAYARHMGGKAHIYWHHLSVWPHWQRKGVGTAMMRWAFNEFDLDHLPIYLATQTLGEAMYKTLGFQVAEIFDVDLRDYAPGYLEGYGLHRIVCMLRPPVAQSVIEN